MPSNLMEATLTDSDVRAGTLRRAIRQALLQEQPVHVASKELLELRDAAAAEAQAAAARERAAFARLSREERRARRKDIAREAFAGLTASLEAVTSTKDVTGTKAPTPGETITRTTICAADLRKPHTALPEPMIPRCTMDVVVVPSSFADVEAAASKGLASAEPARKLHVPPSIEELGDRHPRNMHTVASYAEVKSKVRRNVSNAELADALKALRETEAKRTEDDDPEDLDWFVNWRLDDQGGDRYLVACFSSCEPDPLLGIFVENDLERLVDAGAQREAVREIRTTIELPVSMAEWAGSDRSWPAYVNGAKVQNTVVARRGVPDGVVSEITARIVDGDDEGANRMFQQAVAANTMRGLDINVSLAPPSLAIGESLRLIARAGSAHIANAAGENLDSMYKDMKDEDEDDQQDQRIGRRFYSGNGYVEAVARCLSETLKLGITGNFLKDDAAQRIYLNLKEADEGSEEAAAMTAVLGYGGVAEEITSVVVTTPLLRAEATLTGVQPSALLPRSETEAKAVTVASMIAIAAEEAVPSLTPGLPLTISKSELREVRRNPHVGRPELEVDDEKELWEIMDLRRLDVRVPATIQQIQDRSSVRVVIAFEDIETPMSRYKAAGMLAKIGAPVLRASVRQPLEKLMAHAFEAEIHRFTVVHSSGTRFDLYLAEAEDLEKYLCDAVVFVGGGAAELPKLMSDAGVVSLSIAQEASPTRPLLDQVLSIVPAEAAQRGQRKPGLLDF